MKKFGIDHTSVQFASTPQNLTGIFIHSLKGLMVALTSLQLASSSSSMVNGSHVSTISGAATKISAAVFNTAILLMKATSFSDSAVTALRNRTTTCSKIDYMIYVRLSHSGNPRLIEMSHYRLVHHVSAVQ